MNPELGFLCAAGGRPATGASWTSPTASCSTSRTCIVPRFVYATYEAFEEGKLTSRDLYKRIEQLVQPLTEAGRALVN